MDRANESTYRCVIGNGEFEMSGCVGKNGDHWEIYYANDGWRWRRTASNGRIVGASSQGYSNRTDCIDNARRNGMDCDPA
jgi:uncharacterized protein YegP (UPF0339 family)